MSPRTALLRVGASLAVVAATLIGFAPPASAATGLNLSMSFPSSVVVGATDLPVSFTIANASSGAQATGNVTLDTIELSPGCLTCGGAAALAPSGSAIGAAGSACAGTMFELSSASGPALTFTATPPVVLQPPGSGAASSCGISLTVGLGQLPATDADIATPGVQLDEALTVSAHHADATSATVTVHTTSTVAARTPVMASVNKNGTDSAPTPGGAFGAEQPAISSDGLVVAFVSKSPAELLVNDAAQVGLVTDTNGVEDVFVRDARGAAPVTTLLSWNSAHTATGNGASRRPVMAQTGVGLVFESAATNLVTTPVVATTNLFAWAPGVFSGIKLVNVASSGTTGANSSATDPSIAVSATPPVAKVAFSSSASDLVGADTHAVGQVYVRNLSAASESTALVSVNFAGAGAVNGAVSPMVSASGLAVAFMSDGSDLVSGVTPTAAQIWTRNLVSSTTALISHQNGAATTPGNGASANPLISGDGSVVAFESLSTNLTSDIDTNGTTDIYAFKAGTNTLMSKGPLGAGAPGPSRNPSLSFDGNTVTFESGASDLVPNVLDTSHDTNGVGDVFVSNLLTSGVPRLVSVRADGTASGDAASFLCPAGTAPYCGSSTNPGTVNTNGTAVAFFSNATDIAPATGGSPPASAGNAFVRYPFVSNTVNVSLTNNAQNPDGASSNPVISSDGGTVAFTSLADNLATPDTNAASDVFVANIRNSVVPTTPAAVDESGSSDPLLAGKVRVWVPRVGANGTTDTVHFTTVDGIDPAVSLPPQFTGAAVATAGSDYTAASGTLAFSPGEALKAVDIAVADDTLDEAALEVFRVVLDSPTGAAMVSRTTAYVAIADNDASGPPAQDWHVNISTTPPASAQVGDTVPVGYTVSVDSGADNLAVSSVASGVGTNGLDSPAFPSPPTTVTAGTTSSEATATARVVAAPGTAGVKLEVAVTGALGGATAATKNASTSAVAVTEAVTGALSVDKATATLADQLTYTLTFTNGSDTPAQLSGLPAGFVAPAGTTGGPATGATTVPGNGSTAWSLVVDVNDSDANGLSITETPSSVSYAMSAVGLAARPVAITPASVSTTVHAPVVAVTNHTLIDANGGTLVPGDTVNVSVTVHNAGSASATATLSDTLANLAGPTNVALDGSPCVACSTTTSSVTAPLGSLAPAGSHVVTFAATVPASPSGNTASSTATVSFAPATTGTSPTSPDVASLTIAARTASATTLTSSANPSVFGEVVHLTAKVCGTPPQAFRPGGSIAFMEGTTSLGVRTLSAGGGTGCAKTTFTTAALAVGSHTITAVYGGDAAFVGSSGSINQIVHKASTQTVILSSPNPSAFGEAVTLAATVCPKAPSANATAPPTGTVSFQDGASTLGSATLVAGAGPHCAHASLTTTSLPPGARSLRATYGGDANFLSSTGTTTNNVRCSHAVSGDVNSVSATSGSTCVTDANVRGPVSVSPGATLFMTNSSVSGSVSSDRAAAITMCGNQISGALRIVKTRGFVFIGGDGAANCARNVINGSLLLQTNHGGLRVAGNQIAGSATVMNNNAAPLTADPGGGQARIVVRHNRFRGRLDCSGNDPPATDDGVSNSVTGARTGECAAATF